MCNHIKEIDHAFYLAKNKKWLANMFDLFDYQSQPLVLHVRVTPKAKVERIKKEIRVDGTVFYKVYVHAPPEDGKANEAVIKLLSQVLGLSKSSITITHGHTNREKTIKINR